MKGFRNTSKMVSGHHNVAARDFSTFGRQRFAQGGPVMAPDIVHGLHANPQLTEREPSGNMHGHAAVHREVPSTEELAEHGGKSPLTAGYAKGGKAKHFHVHNHYHSGGKVKTKSKHYGAGGATRKMEMQAESEFEGKADGFGGTKTGSTRDRLKKGGRMKKATGGTINKVAKGGHIHDDTHPVSPDYKKGGVACKATGGTINKMGAGGALYKRGGLHRR